MRATANYIRFADSLPPAPLNMRLASLGAALDATDPEPETAWEVCAELQQGSPDHANRGEAEVSGDPQGD